MDAGRADDAGAMLRFLRNISVDTTVTSHHYADDLLSREQDPDSVSDEVLIDVARAFVDEWSSRWRLRKRERCGGDARAGAEGCGFERDARMTTFEWAMGCGAPGARFGLWEQVTSVETARRVAVTPRSLTDVLKREKYVLVQLVKALKKRDLVVRTADEERDGEGVCERHFVRVAESISSAYHVCLEELRLRVNQPDDGGDDAAGGADDDSYALHDSVSTEDRFVRKHALLLEPGDMSAFERLHEAMLARCKLYGFRKIKDELYQEILVEIDGVRHRTYAWEPAYAEPRPSTFETLMTESVGRYIDYQTYKDASVFGERERVLLQLQKEEEPECPTLERSRLFISFRNCVVHILGACFPFGMRHRWEEIAARKNAEWASFSRECAARLAQLGVDVQPFDLTTRAMSDTGESMVIRPPRENEASSHFIDEDLPEACMNLRFDGSNFAHHPEGDANPACPWGSRIFAYLDEIECREFDTVQRSQDWDLATRFWDLCMLGRGMLPGKTLDFMHVYPMRQGRAGTGKSLTIQIFEVLLPKGKFKTLSSTAQETTFWGHGMQHAWVIAWLEAQAKGKPPIDKGTWQQMTSFEHVNLPQKNAGSISMPWRACAYVAGNEWPGWEDAAGSLRRRTMTFLYQKKITNTNVQFESQMKRRVAPLLIKMMHSYSLMVMLFPNMNWQDELPVERGSATRLPIIGKQLQTYHKSAAEHLDPLQAFVSTPNRFDFGPELLMPESEFIEEYNKYREKICGLGRARWNPATYTIVFESRDIERRSAEWTDQVTGRTSNVMCLCGIAPKDTEGVVA